VQLLRLEGTFLQIRVQSFGKAFLSTNIRVNARFSKFFERSNFYNSAFAHAFSAVLLDEESLCYKG